MLALIFSYFYVWSSYFSFFNFPCQFGGSLEYFYSVIGIFPFCYFFDQTPIYLLDWPQLLNSTKSQGPQVNDVPREALFSFPLMRFQELKLLMEKGRCILTVEFVKKSRPGKHKWDSALIG